MKFREGGLGKNIWISHVMAHVLLGLRNMEEKEREREREKVRGRNIYVDRAV